MLGDLAFLNTLNLQANKLRSIPLSISKLVYLEQFILDSNLLEELPIEIG